MMAVFGTKINFFLFGFILILTNCKLIKFCFLLEMTASNRQVKSFASSRDYPTNSTYKIEKNIVVYDLAAVSREQSC